jgi:hypothetical protein
MLDAEGILLLRNVSNYLAVFAAYRRWRRDWPLSQPQILRISGYKYSLSVTESRSFEPASRNSICIIVTNLMLKPWLDYPVQVIPVFRKIKLNISWQAGTLLWGDTKASRLKRDWSCRKMLFRVTVVWHSPFEFRCRHYECLRKLLQPVLTNWIGDDLWQIMSPTCHSRVHSILTHLTKPIAQCNIKFWLQSLKYSLRTILELTC